MRIAFFSDTYYPQLNGVATVVGYFARHLRKKGHSVYLFAPKIKGYKDNEADVYRIPSIRALPSLPDSIRIPLPVPHKTLLKIYQLDFDLVHAHGNGIFSLIGLGVAKAKKVPYILTFHTQVGKFAHYFLKGKVVKPKHLNEILLKRFANLCDGIIAPSRKMRDELTGCGVKKHIEVIPNFVELEKFKTLQKSNFLHNMLKIPKDSPILLAVGRLGKEKNFEFLIEIFEKITKLNKDAHLVIVGEGFEYKRLKKVGSKLNLDARFHMTGGIPIDDMPKVYSDADMFVFPSVSEIHPMVVIEAAASGLPLLVAKDAAYLGVVIDNQNGYLLPLDKEIFAQTVVKLLKNPSLMKKFSNNSPKIVEKNFGSDLLINKLTTFYDQIIKEYQKKRNNSVPDF